MHSLFFRSLCSSVLVLGLAACDSEDSTDSGSSTTGGETTDPAGTGEDASTAAATAETAPATTAADSSGGLVLADVEVTINYEGDATGLLNVIAVTTFPPSGPPLAAASEMEPTFPWTGTLIDLEAGGEYVIVAVLDTGELNPQVPGPEDLVVLTEEPLVVDDEGPYSVELTLTDPM